MADHKNQALNLFQKCKVAYDSRKITRTSSYNGFPAPGLFDNEYNVYSELLFIELCQIDQRWADEHLYFNNKLISALNSSEEFSIDNFVSLDKRQQQRQYQVLFEIFVENGIDNTKRYPFPRRIETDDKIVFRRCPKIAPLEAAQKLAKSAQEAKTLRRVPSLPISREKDIFGIKAEVMATNSSMAAQKVFNAFNLIENCFNVSQALNNYSITLFSRKENNLKPRTTLTSTGFYAVLSEEEKDNDIYYADEKSILPNHSCDHGKSKATLFKKLLNATFTPSPIQDRVRLVVRDLATAFETEDDGLRRLSFWRCLEHATRYKGHNRKEKEIINIFKNYCPDDFWRKMGDLILKSRNDYVHTGTISGQEIFRGHYTNWAQKYAEVSLFITLYLFKDRSFWNTEDKIDEFFDYYPKSLESLELAKKYQTADKNATKRNKITEIKNLFYKNKVGF